MKASSFKECLYIFAKLFSNNCPDFFDTFEVETIISWSFGWITTVECFFDFLGGDWLFQM